MALSGGAVLSSPGASTHLDITWSHLASVSLQGGQSWEGNIQQFYPSDGDVRCPPGQRLDQSGTARTLS